MALKGKKDNHHHLTKAEKKKQQRKKKKLEKKREQIAAVKRDFKVNEIFEDQADLDEQYRALKSNVLRALGPSAIKDLIHTASAKTLEQKIYDSFEKYQASGDCADATFTLFDLTCAIVKFKDWINLLPRVIPFYAMKCNPDFHLIKTLVACGAGLDCASMAEIKNGLESGLSPDKIIFANPCKMLAHIKYAKSKGIRMMTFDNKQELLKVHSIYPEAKMVLRILGDDSHSVMRFGSKFGARVDTEARDLLQSAYSLGLQVCGVSFHVGSGCMSSEAFVNSFTLARQVFDMAEEMGHPMNLLDIGGGFPGTDTEELKFANIATDICEALDKLFPDPNITIIAEPGRYFASECVVLVTSVIARRDRVITVRKGEGSDEEDEEGEATEEKLIQYYISDGVYGSFNNLFFDHAHACPVGMSRPGTDLSAHPPLPPERSILFGPTCDSIDVICKDIWMPPMEIGDLVYFFNMGAYTSAAASSFNGFAPPKPHYLLC